MKSHDWIFHSAVLLLALVHPRATADVFEIDDATAADNAPKSTVEQRAKWRAHTPLLVDDHHLNSLVRLSDTDRFNATLAQILVPRVVGSPGHTAVRQFIQHKMSGLRWHLDRDRFDEATPNMGTLTFENIIATLNPAAERYLVLACHYDSKYFADSEFLGASDSAVPCAMLIDMAEALHERLLARSATAAAQLSLKLIFFDGEEAFDQWTDTDSLYGSRHLANRWKDEGKLEKIDMLVLLDLLGMPDPQFYSLFRDTDPWYAHMADCEQRLAQLDLIERDSNSGVVPRRANTYFMEQFLDAFIDDDHAPFMRYGVPIVHVIPLPFPDEWHTPNDDWHVVDFVTVDNLSRILRLFVVEYLNMEME